MSKIDKIVKKTDDNICFTIYYKINLQYREEPVSLAIRAGLLFDIG